MNYDTCVRRYAEALAGSDPDVTAQEAMYALRHFHYLPRTQNVMREPQVVASLQKIDKFHVSVDGFAIRGHLRKLFKKQSVVLPAHIPNIDERAFLHNSVSHISSCFPICKSMGVNDIRCVMGTILFCATCPVSLYEPYITSSQEDSRNIDAGRLALASLITSSDEMKLHMPNPFMWETLLTDMLDMLIRGLVMEELLDKLEDWGCGDRHDILSNNVLWESLTRHIQTNHKRYVMPHMPRVMRDITLVVRGTPLKCEISSNKYHVVSQPSVSGKGSSSKLIQSARETLAAVDNVGLHEYWELVTLIGDELMTALSSRCKTIQKNH